MNYLLNTCDAEYAKDGNLRKEDIQQLLQWGEKQPHLPKITEYMIIQFYVSSDYSLLRTKELIEGHYKFRNELPELFTACDADKERLGYEFHDSWFYGDLPVTKKSRNVIYIGIRDSDVSHFTWESFSNMLIKANFTTILSRGGKGSCYWIVDGEGCTLGHFLTAKLWIIRGMVRYLQTYIPMKIEKIFLIRINFFAEKVYMLMRQFFNEEMDRKVTMLQEPRKLFDYIPKECIPSELGGTLPQTREELTEIERVRLAALNDAVVEELHRRADEKKRIGNNGKDISSVASFRNIEID